MTDMEHGMSDSDALYLSDVEVDAANLQLGGLVRSRPLDPAQLAEQRRREEEYRRERAAELAEQRAYDAATRAEQVRSQALHAALATQGANTDHEAVLIAARAYEAFLKGDAAPFDA